jgi:hypothetical protein
MFKFAPTASAGYASDLYFRGVETLAVTYRGNGEWYAEVTDYDSAEVLATGTFNSANDAVTWANNR